MDCMSGLGVSKNTGVLKINIMIFIFFHYCGVILFSVEKKAMQILSNVMKHKVAFKIMPITKYSEAHL